MNIQAGKWYKLYKRNAKNIPVMWSGAITGQELWIEYGTVNGKTHKELIFTNRAKIDELKSRINAKRKEGYKELYELKDNISLSTSETLEEMVEYGDNQKATLLSFLTSYLPKYNTTSDGFILPMLAKTLEDNTPFEKYGIMLGQWKINGLRCIIGATEVNTIFDKVRLTYHSREGVDWTDKLSWMDNILIPRINFDLLYMMSRENVCLDGELYLPGYSVNDINSFVKNKLFMQHQQLQYWVYDVCIENMTAYNRAELLKQNIACPIIDFTYKEDHLNNEQQLVLLPTFHISNIQQATACRDDFISAGFEGLILRNPNNEYQFGKRNASMFKYKKKDDGLFEVIAINADKRGLPIYTLKNDINDSLFECTINLPQDKQRDQLLMKEHLIGKKGLVEFRERSGVQQVPFHAKLIKIYV